MTFFKKCGRHQQARAYKREQAAGVYAESDTTEVACEHLTPPTPTEKPHLVDGVVFCERFGGILLSITLSQYLLFQDHSDHHFCFLLI